MGAKGGFGAKFKIEVNAVMTAVAKIEDFQFPEEEAITDEITTHDSTGGWKEHIKTGLRSLNEFELTLVWDRSQTTHDTLVAAFQSDSAVKCSVEDKDGDEVIAFNANITKLGREVEKDKAIRCKVTVEPTGGPTGDTAESV